MRTVFGMPRDCSVLSPTASLIERPLSPGGFSRSGRGVAQLVRTVWEAGRRFNPLQPETFFFSHGCDGGRRRSDLPSPAPSEFQRLAFAQQGEASMSAQCAVAVEVAT